MPRAATMISSSSSAFDLPTYFSDNVPALPGQPSRNSSADDILAAFIVISGGTGGNSICSAFDDVCYVLPVSDDGGSSSEIIRVLGGPSIGYYSLLSFDHPLTF